VGISEAQLEAWSAQGKTGQFTETYNSIRGNLLDGSAPYPVKNCEVFLQGSYGNDTNVWADSDVDTVLKHSGHDGLVFYTNGQRIENFPKQHSENCTAKHKATSNNFKRGFIRICATR
jgi:hypothetical protein